jgi:thioredoxin-dependent peroxiredoxin
MASIPDVGDTAPDFTLQSTEGELTLSKRLKSGPVLLVFYPGDDTPVCTKQLCNYRDNLDTFADLGVEVLAINPQTDESHRKFATKHKLPFPLLSDPGGKVCKEYGALNFLGMAKRALVLIGKDRKVKWRQTSLPIFHKSADDVRKAIAGLVA